MPTFPPRPADSEYIPSILAPLCAQMIPITAANTPDVATFNHALSSVGVDLRAHTPPGRPQRFHVGLHSPPGRCQAAHPRTRGSRRAYRPSRKRTAPYAYPEHKPLPSLDDALPMDTAAITSTTTYAEDELKNKNKNTDRPGVTAKNMRGDMKFQVAVAAQAAGPGTSKYVWMHAESIPSGPPVEKTSAAATAALAPAGWIQPFQSSKKKDETPTDEDNMPAITLRDAIFVVEHQRGYGGDRGAPTGWT